MSVPHWPASNGSATQMYEPEMAEQFLIQQMLADLFLNSINQLSCTILALWSWVGISFQGYYSSLSVHRFEVLGCATTPF